MGNFSYPDNNNNSNFRGLQPGLRGLKPNLRALKLDLKGPKLGLRGPQPGLRGLEPSLRGLKPDLKDLDTSPPAKSLRPPAKPLGLSIRSKGSLKNPQGPPNRHQRFLFGLQEPPDKPLQFNSIQFKEKIHNKFRQAAGPGYRRPHIAFGHLVSANLCTCLFVCL